MIYVFEDFELDAAKVELRAKGAPVAIEPQVFALLLLLVENRERLVSKDEIVERIWDGRIISDAAIASRVKSVRQALGDDGRGQRLIRTVHGTGFRFVGEVTSRPTVSMQTVSLQEVAIEPPAEAPPLEAARPSIAVLPFRLVGVAGPQGAIADALPHDLITELSRMHWLFVIARASSFRFRGADAEIDNVRQALNVRYCLSGMVEIVDRDMTVSVELSDTNDRRVVWGERYRGKVDAVHEIREQIARSVVTALELQIPLNEARRARLKMPEHLDAWSVYHLGLQHMYRFTKPDNIHAIALFERAAAMEPSFARAYAGLSFTHWQDAFLGYSDDISHSGELARRYAEQSLERDPLDPFGNFTMGRTHWLSGDIEGSLSWLDRANDLNPNYAQGRYSRAWVEGLLGQSEPCLTNVGTAMALSPLDPMRYAMLATRAFGYLLQGRAEEAADWGERGAQSPGAHALVQMIAVALHGLNGDEERAKFWAAMVKARDPEQCQARFFQAFPFRDASTRKLVAGALARYGF